MPERCVVDSRLIMFALLAQRSTVVQPHPAPESSQPDQCHQPHTHNDKSNAVRKGAIL